MRRLDAPRSSSLYAALRGMVERSSFAFRYRRRTNPLLGVAHLVLKNHDDVGTYLRALSEATEAGAGSYATRRVGTGPARRAVAALIRLM